MKVLVCRDKITVNSSEVSVDSMMFESSWACFKAAFLEIMTLFSQLSLSLIKQASFVVKIEIIGNEVIGWRKVKQTYRTHLVLQQQLHPSLISEEKPFRFWPTFRISLFSVCPEDSPSPGNFQPGYIIIAATAAAPPTLNSRCIWSSCCLKFLLFLHFLSGKYCTVIT